MLARTALSARACESCARVASSQRDNRQATGPATKTETRPALFARRRRDLRRFRPPNPGAWLQALAPAESRRLCVPRLQNHRGRTLDWTAAGKQIARDTRSKAGEAKRPPSKERGQSPPCLLLCVLVAGAAPALTEAIVDCRSIWFGHGMQRRQRSEGHGQDRQKVQSPPDSSF